MPTRVITLPDGRAVTLGTYVKAWRAVKTVPPDELIFGWSHFSTPASRILADIRQGIADRINRDNPAAMQYSPAEHDLHRFHRHYTTAPGKTRLVLRETDLPRGVSPRLLRRIRKAFAYRTED